MQFTSRELRYFHHKYRGGKSIPAHILDCTLGAILLWALLFFALRFFGAPWRGALLLGLCLCISLGSFVAILWRYRFQRFLSRELARLRRGVSLESLTLLPEADYEAICRQLFAARFPDRTPRSAYRGYYYPEEACFCYAFHNHPKAPVGIRQMMAIYRKLQRLGASACCLLSASSYVDDAAAFSRRLGISFTLLGQKELLSFAAQTLPPVSEAQLHRAIEEEMRHFYAEGGLIHNAVAPNKYRAYLTCAFFLLLWYFLFRFNLLYPIAAVLCLLLALASYRTSRGSSLKAGSTDSSSTDGK